MGGEHKVLAMKKENNNHPEEENSDKVFVFKGSECLPQGSAVFRLVESIEKRGGLVKVNGDAHFDGAGVKLPNIMLEMKILSNPNDPANQWSTLVEFIKINGQLYMRLVNSLPLKVKIEWERSGKSPDYLSSISLQGLVDAYRPMRPKQHNPFKPGSICHTAFDLGSEWIPLNELINRIADNCYGGNRRKATNIWCEISRHDRKARCRIEERIRPDGTKEVQAISLVSG